MEVVMNQGNQDKQQQDKQQQGGSRSRMCDRATNDQTAIKTSSISKVKNNWTLIPPTSSAANKQ
jgi:hypothetical protein